MDFKNIVAFATKIARAIIACATITMLCICTAPIRVLAWILRTVGRPFEFIRVTYARIKKKLLTWSFSKKKDEPVQASSCGVKPDTTDVLDEVFGEHSAPARKRWSWRKVALCCLVIPVALAFALAVAEECMYVFSSSSAPASTSASASVDDMEYESMSGTHDSTRKTYILVDVKWDSIVVNGDDGTFAVIPSGVEFDADFFRAKIGREFYIQADPNWDGEIPGVLLYTPDGKTCLQDKWIAEGALLPQ